MMHSTSPLEKSYWRRTPDESARAHDELAATTRDRGRRILIRGAVVLSQDPAVGDFEKADILVVGDTISAVGSDLAAAARDGNCIVVNAAGMIATPGLVDTHRHLWQSQFRRVIPDVDDLIGYVVAMHQVLAPAYRPEDHYAANLIGALGALDSGVTSVLDFSHNSRSYEHRQQAVRGLIDSRIRAVHAAGPVLHGKWDERWPTDVVRLRDEHTSDERITVRLAAQSSEASAGRPDKSASGSVSLDAELLRFARSNGLEVSVDGVIGFSEAERAGTAALVRHLGPDVTLIHCSGLSRESWQAIADAGATVSLTPTSDAQIMLGECVPPIQQALDAGVAPSLSVDTESALSGDMWTQMRTVLNVQRMLTGNLRFQGQPAPAPVTTTDVLRMATINGAVANGLGEKTGSLTPGKQADILLLAANDIANAPLNTAIGTVVNGVDSSQVHTVFVGGEVVKAERRLIGVIVDEARELAATSRARILERSAYTSSVL